MKILTGELKGRNFYMPAHIRPTQNITRKAVIDIIGQDLTGLSFLDLFAGSGGMGFEAYSCGAQNVVLVERDFKCGDVIRENMEILGVSSFSDDGRHCELLATDVFAAIKGFARQNKRFDIVFIDPPYDEGMAKKTLKTLGAYDILTPNCRIVVEHGKREGLPYFDHGFDVLIERKYGKSYLLILEAKRA